MRKSKGSVNPFSTPNTSLHTVRKSKGSVKPFRTPNTMRNTIANLFLKTSRTLTPPFFSHFTSTLPLRISLPLCGLFTVSPPASVLVPPSIHTPPSHLTPPSLSHSTPPFEHGPKGPLLPLRRVALRGREPPLLEYLVICHLRRPPQRPRRFPFLRVECPLVPHILLLSAGMRIGDQLLHKGRLFRALRVQCGALLPKGLGLQAHASHLELHSLSLLLLHMLELLQILSFLLTCHWGLLSDAQCSQHHPLRATQIADRDLSTQSPILIRRPSDRSQSFETLMAYYRGTILSSL